MPHRSVRRHGGGRRLRLIGRAARRLTPQPPLSCGRRGAVRPPHRRPRHRRGAPRLRGVASADAPQRRRPAADALGHRPADRLGHQPARLRARALRLRARQRRAHPRARGVRRDRAVPAHRALAGPERPDRAQAVGHARGDRVGGVPQLRAAGAVPRQGGGRDPGLQRGGQHRPGAAAHPRDRVRARDGGAGDGRRLARPDGRDRARARRRGGPPRDQPRRRRRAAHRLPPDGRLRGPDRRDARRRRPAPARGDGAARRAGGGRDRRHGARLARASGTRSPITSPARWGSSSSTGWSR